MMRFQGLLLVPRPPCLTLTHEQAAVRGSVDGDAAGRGELLPDQILCGALEVIEAILLVPQRAGCRRDEDTEVKER